MFAKRIAPALIALSLVGLPVVAETMDHSGHAMMGADAPSTKAFMEANMKMHGGMEIDYTGDADVDFVRGMIAHHQGAIDMAKVVLEHGDRTPGRNPRPQARSRPPASAPGRARVP